MLLYDKHNMKIAECQDGDLAKLALSDKTAKGKERPWRLKKQQSELLSALYEDIDEKKAYRMSTCADFLKFGIKTDDTKKLKEMWSCRVRLCPMCAWRRSLKVHRNTVKILDAMCGDYAYVFLTLTVRNCSAAELADLLDQMLSAWHRLSKRKAFLAAVKGWYRGLEVTHNVNPQSPSYDTYHPHFHCLLAVRKGYFTGKEYLSKDEWTALWRKSMQLDYDPVVDVRKVTGTTSAAVAEAAKYTVKESDYIVPQDLELSVATVRTLDKALENRRLVAFGGVMKEWHQKLNLDDEVDGDLIHVDGDETKAELTDKEMVFAWHTGYSQYFRMERGQ